jgi:hypothetical protein
MSEIDEVKHLLSIATFPGVKKMLDNYSKQLSAQQTASAPAAELTDAEPEPVESVAPKRAATAPASKVAAPTPRPVVTGVFVPIDDFAWDQVTLANMKYLK